MKFNDDRQLAEYIQSQGGDLWLVGGAVRDQMMVGQANDHDYLVTGLNPEVLPFETVVGNAFPVYLIYINKVKCELALARKEVKVGKGYKGFECFADEKVTLEEDLSRRDLTINSMAVHVLTGELVDPFHGQTDLQQKVLRHTTKAFAEDPLRVYRVARFASRFVDFSLASDTIGIMRSMKAELKELSSERVWKELEKALSSEQPERFFQVLAKAELLQEHFTEIPADGDFSLLSAVDDLEKRFGLLALLLPDSTECLDQIKALCERISAPKSFEKVALLTLQHKDAFLHLDPANGEVVVPLILRFKSDIQNVINVLARFYKWDHLAEADQLETKWMKAVEVVMQIEKEITGKSLIEEGLKPGKELGEILLQRRIRAFEKRI